VSHAAESGLSARRFDGRSSRAVTVSLRALPEGLQVTGTERALPELYPLQSLVVDEPLGAVRRIGLPDGGHLEVVRGPALDALLATLGWRERAVSRAQRSVRHAVVALLLLVGGSVAGYLWGLPLLAATLAPLVPTSLVAQLDQHSLASMRNGLLQPSFVSASRRERLQAGLAALGAEPKLQLHFHRFGPLGANAFALPGGSVVLGDELVALAPDDAHVLAVLAHEAGHVERRHGLRMLIQGSVTAVVMGLWIGDFSGLAASASSLALTNRYSREFEDEADAYAVGLLQRAGQDPLALARMLQLLEASHAPRGQGEQRAPAKDGGAPDESPASGVHDWLSTHPATAARIARIRALASGQPVLER